ncbi:DUF4396 domain-containing protein [Bilophila wadsworthia]|uniref:DUF4396 domain-containing protein n=1 Tax=Bilophila wadsworthia TaxID=35833 RepID=UPI002674FE20|nr:DUF4396 domain-containing protein [Bilophila wadsworthia]
MESSMYWLDLIAETYIGICVLCCLFIISKQQRRPAPMMRVMLLVWPIITLWAGPLGIWAYETSNRRMPSHDGDGGARHGMSDMHMEMPMQPMHSHTPHWKSVMTGTLHCGAGCTLADLTGPFLFRMAPFVLFGSSLYGEWAVDYVLALIIGVFFQYAGLASMSHDRGLSLWFRAFKVDFLSLTAWQVGMYGWMAIAVFLLVGPMSPDQPVFWLMMQISMICGFITAYPMNWWLIRIGIKSAM